MYVPPERMFSSFSYSAFAAACFSSSVLTGGLARPLVAISLGSSRLPLRLGEGDLRRGGGEGDLTGDLVRERSFNCCFGESSSILSSSILRGALGSSLSPLRRGGEADPVAALTGDLTGDLVVENSRASFLGKASSFTGDFCVSGDAEREDICEVNAIRRVAGLVSPRGEFWSCF